MLPGVWGLFASSGATLLVAISMTAVFLFRGKHRDADGTLLNGQVVSFFLLVILAYTLAVIITSVLVFDGPPPSELIEHGFGDERIAWLMLGVLVDNAVRVWDQLI